MGNLDLRESEHCEDMKEVASKVGVQVVCNDEDEKAYEDALAFHVHAPDDEACENTKEVFSKVGMQVVCDDEEA